MPLLKRVDYTGGLVRYRKFCPDHLRVTTRRLAHANRLRDRWWFQSNASREGSCLRQLISKLLYSTHDTRTDAIDAGRICLMALFCFCTSYPFACQRTFWQSAAPLPAHPAFSPATGRRTNIRHLPPSTNDRCPPPSTPHPHCSGHCQQRHHHNPYRHHHRQRHHHHHHRRHGHRLHMEYSPLAVTVGASVRHSGRSYRQG